MGGRLELDGMQKSTEENRGAEDQIAIRSRSGATRTRDVILPGECMSLWLHYFHSGILFT